MYTSGNNLPGPLHKQNRARRFFPRIKSVAPDYLLIKKLKTRKKPGKSMILAMRRNPFWCETYPDWQFCTVDEMRKNMMRSFNPKGKDCYHLYDLE